MCGIVGIVGRAPVAPLIVDALKRLEYRGYDSAGVATVDSGRLGRRRAEGKLVNLERRLIEEPLDGTIGIGHTRWATHGVPNETNAHPHFSGEVAVVHNGIIENFAELRASLIADGYEFASQTDTEVVAHLVTRELKSGLEPIEAAHAALKKLEGAFALAIMFSGEDDLIIGARNGPPLAVGHGEGEMYLGSDAIALAPFTNAITYLEDGDWAIIRRDGMEIFDLDGNRVERQKQQSVGTSYLVDKGNYRHFMEKEIHEQPEVVSHTLAHYLDFTTGTAKQFATPFDFAAIDRLAVSACGTAYLAGLVGKYWFERYARLPVDIDVASEFRYREMPLSKARGDRQCARIDHRARIRRRLPDAGRAGDRRRIDQGVHLPAFRARLARGPGGGRPRHGDAGAGSGAGAPAFGGAEAHQPDAEARAAHREAGARAFAIQGRALSRPRHRLSAGAGRRVEAEGNLLHPRRGLCGGRIEAWADRADRRKDAGGGDRPA
jgi:glucosamine--fructose-6-phosphate aminotransferase (isomerizing)